MTNVVEGPVYLAECLWPGIDPEQVRSASERAEAVARARASVRYLGSILVLQDEVVLFEFTAASEADVADACRAAGIDFERIVLSEQVHATRRGEVR